MKTEADIRIAALHKKAKAFLKQGIDEDELIEELKKEGIDSGYAQLIIENVKGDIRNQRDAWKLTLMGIFFIVGGICINYFSYQIAVNANAIFFLRFLGNSVAGHTDADKGIFSF